MPIGYSLPATTGPSPGVGGSPARTLRLCLRNIQKHSPAAPARLQAVRSGSWNIRTRFGGIRPGLRTIPEPERTIRTGLGMFRRPGRMIRNASGNTHSRGRMFRSASRNIRPAAGMFREPGRTFPEAQRMLRSPVRMLQQAVRMRGPPGGCLPAGHDPPCLCPRPRPQDRRRRSERLRPVTVGEEIKLQRYQLAGAGAVKSRQKRVTVTRTREMIVSAYCHLSFRIAAAARGRIHPGRGRAPRRSRTPSEPPDGRPVRETRSGPARKRPRSRARRLDQLLQDLLSLLVQPHGSRSHGSTPCV